MADFTEMYGIRLHQRPEMSWAEFRDHVEGILSVDSRLSRAFQPTPPEPIEAWGEGTTLLTPTSEGW